MTPPAAVLSDAELTSRLAELPQWEGDHLGIVRTVKFPTFLAGIEAVRRIAEVAEELNHHPDIDIRWRTVRFTCATHSVGGVTEHDLRLAKRIDELAAAGVAE